MLLSLIPALAMVAASPAVDPPDRRPNIVLILADDLGPGDLGGSVAPTPQIDRMASEGTSFSRYYSAAPICSPSRCGLLTGQSPGRWRITSYLQTKAGNRACGQADFLDPAAPSLPRVLKSAGYATEHVGKWHLGGGRDVVDAPKFAAYGYDLGLGTYESPEPHPDLTAREWIWSAVDPVKRWDRTRWMVDRTLDFLRSHPDQPCFVNLWLDDPHTPWVPSAEDQEAKPDGRASGKANTPARLKGVMIELDRQVGRLLQELRDHPSSRPTLVLFLSDNGPLPPFAGQARTGKLKGSKLSLYEGGIRLPFIAWGPGLVPAGKTNAATVLTAFDLFPSLARIAGAELPIGYQGDGEDLSPAILGASEPIRTRPVFWEYGRGGTGFAYPAPKNRSPDLAMLDGDWKILANLDGSGTELYDLARDPQESVNLATERPEAAARLQEALLRWRKTLP
ncbi:sulfatase family protein [Tundrisphaera lichenicola]|uniref:sulfatase family protein n=1 Tax=Tundrisphaera lichenicola TaxID=2029860 RepID=UPI003EB7EF4B